MIRHIVMFRFRSDVDEETRRQVREQFRADILSLRSQLDFIRSLTFARIATSRITGQPQPA